MKLFKSVQLATAMNIAHGQAIISPGEIALATGCDLIGTKPNAYLGGCVSDDYCNGLDGHRIFNHFHITSDSVKGFGQTLQLVPECRQIGAEITAGFTCGNDPSLVNGTEVVIPNVPETGFDFDSRTIKLLKRAKYESLSTALRTHMLCENEPKTHTCDSINHFSDGCSSAIDSTNGFTRFMNFFAVEECEPEVKDYHEDNGLVEEYKIYIGYDDLTFQLPNGNEAILNVHKVSQNRTLNRTSYKQLRSTRFLARSRKRAKLKPMLKSKNKLAILILKPALKQISSSKNISVMLPMRGNEN